MTTITIKSIHSDNNTISSTAIEIEYKREHGKVKINSTGVNTLV